MLTGLHPMHIQWILNNLLCAPIARVFATCCTTHLFSSAFFFTLYLHRFAHIVVMLCHGYFVCLWVSSSVQNHGCHCYRIFPQFYVERSCLTRFQYQAIFISYFDWIMIRIRIKWMQILFPPVKKHFHLNAHIIADVFPIHFCLQMNMGRNVLVWHKLRLKISKLLLLSENKFSGQICTFLSSIPSCINVTKNWTNKIKHFDSSESHGSYFRTNKTRKKSFLCGNLTWKETFKYKINILLQAYFLPLKSRIII